MRAVSKIAIAAAVLISVVAVVGIQAADDKQDYQAASDIIRQQKRTYIEKIMELDAQDKKAFWALYDEYEAGLAKIRNKRIRLAINFLQSHAALSDTEALEMLDQKLMLDNDDLKFKQIYVAKFMKVLPGRKVVRFYQAENRFDTATQAELYRNIPVIK